MTFTIAFDESGTSNHPGDHSEAVDFAVGGLIVPDGHMDRLMRLDATLQEMTHQSDYKFKHVRRNDAARQRFVEGIANSECQLLGDFMPPHAIASQQQRFEIACLRDIGPPPAGTAESSRTKHENMLQVVRFLATITFGIMEGHNYRVFWDRRDDAPQLAAAWDDATSQHARSEKRASGPRLSFEVPHEVRAVVRLAGVFAGDIVAMFRRIGPRVFPLVRTDLSMSRRHPDGILLIPPQQVADCKTPLINPDIDEQSGEGTMLRRYYRRLVNRSLGFFDPTGRACSVRIESNTEWAIYQTPD